MKIIARDIPPRTVWALEQAGVHPLLARLYAARGVLGKDELDDGLLGPHLVAAGGQTLGGYGGDVGDLALVVGSRQVGARLEPLESSVFLVTLAGLPDRYYRS